MPGSAILNQCNLNLKKKKKPLKGKKTIDINKIKQYRNFMDKFLSEENR